MKRRSSRITTLIADATHRTRAALRATLEAEPDFAVVGEAATVNQVVRLATQLHPKLITIDLDMRGGSALDAISAIMDTTPSRVVVVTSTRNCGANDAGFESLCRGAMELLRKPTSWEGEEPQALVERLRRVAAVSFPPPGMKPKAPPRPRRLRGSSRLPIRRPIICIGASTGGPRVVKQILDAFPADLPAPVVIVQHLADISGGAFIRWLGTDSKLRVREARDGVALTPGVAWVAFRGDHIAIEQGARRLCTASLPAREGHKPAINVLFESAAVHCGLRTIGVLLSGMGEDGAYGLKTIASAGGTTLAQSEASSVVFGMPRAAVELGAVQRLVDADEIADEIIALTMPRRIIVQTGGT